MRLLATLPDAEPNDVEAQAPAMVDALEALSEHATLTRLLGTYAKARRA